MADFLGVSNLMRVIAHGDSDGRCRVTLGDFELHASRGETHTTGDTRIVIRPERVHLEPHESSGENRVPGIVERVVYLGNSNQIIVILANGDTVQALVQNTGEELTYKQGDPVRVYLPSEALRVLTDTGTAPIDEGAAAGRLGRVAGSQRSRRRLTISRWMSEVPSSSSSRRASRDHFSTGYSRE